MTRVLLHDYDELVVGQRLTSTTHPNISILLDIAQGVLGDMGLHGDVEHANPRIKTRIIRAPGFDLRLNEEFGGGMEIEAYMKPRSLHVEGRAVYDRVESVLSAVSHEVQGRDNLDDVGIETRRIALHADIAGWPFGVPTVKRFFNPQGYKIAIRRDPDHLRQVNFGRLLKIYDKTLQLREVEGTEWLEDLWGEVEGRVLRYEYTFDRRFLKRAKTTDPNLLWRMGLDRIAVRRRKKGQKDSRTGRWPEDPIMRMLRNLKFQAPSDKPMAPPVPVRLRSDVHLDAELKRAVTALAKKAAHSDLPPLPHDQLAQLILQEYFDRTPAIVEYFEQKYRAELARLRVG